MFNPRKNKKGFTLIELIIVIAIIAILAAVAIPSFLGITQKANESVAVANATSIATAINTYNALNPTSLVVASDIDTYAHFSAKVGADLAVKGLTETTYAAAIAKITYANNVATVNSGS